MMTFSERIAYNNTPIPSLEAITGHDSYNSMIKFNMFERSIVTPNNFWLFVPHKFVHQYTRQKYEDFNVRPDDRTRKEDINGLEIWLSNRGTSTKIVVVPSITSKALKEMEDAKVFFDYFEEKVPAHLSNALEKSYIIIGLEPRFRKSKTKYKFQADNSIYIEVSKILPDQTYKHLQMNLFEIN